MTETRDVIDAGRDGRSAVDRWTECGDVSDWVEACCATRHLLKDPYGRSAEYCAFVAMSVLELTPDQRAQLRRETRPALAEQLEGKRPIEAIPDPQQLDRGGRRGAELIVSALTCGSSADEFAPLPALGGMAAALLGAPSSMLADCFVEWDWSEPETQAWGRAGAEALAEINALCATGMSAIEGWYQTVGMGPQRGPIPKVPATEVLESLQREVELLTQRVADMEDPD